MVLARARARELQVDQQVERAQQPLSAKTAIPTTKAKPKTTTETDKLVCRFFLNQMDAGMEIIASLQIHTPQAPALWFRITQPSSLYPSSPTTVFSLQQCEASAQEALSKGRRRRPRFQITDPGTRKVSQRAAKGKDRKTKPSAKSGDVDFDEDAQAEPDEPEGRKIQSPEAYLVEAQTFEESEMVSDVTLDWSASECKDYKDRTSATVA